MKTLRRRLALLLLALPLALLVAACEDDLVEDATFRLWCGDDRLCAWNVDAGHIERVGTWHRRDPGVEFVDTPTILSQLVEKGGVRCLTFTTIADVAPSAQMTVGVDFDDDGVVDHEQPIVGTGFANVETEVSAPLRYDSFRILLTKKGTGRAVLAQMRVQSKGSCAAPPLRFRDRPLGSPCAQGEPSECRSGVCCEGICAECCTKPRALDVGPDGGAGPGFAPEASCPEGQTCAPREVPMLPDFFATVPQQCDPGGGKRVSGTACLADDDCASGTCEGARSAARNVMSPDAGCAADFPEPGGPDCMFVSVREGQCL